MGWGQRRGRSLRNYPGWRVHNALQFLLATRLRGWQRSHRGADSGHRWEFLWHDEQWRELLWRAERLLLCVLWLRNDLPDHPRWHTDYALQLLLAKRLRRRRNAPSGAGPRYQRNFLRNNVGRWH